MNYPIWEISKMGGGSLIALIAIFHVYISHLAVGGGMYLWLTDRKGFKENDTQIHAYVKKHTWFFLLLTMVFGGVSGVGIWFIIALVSPAATSSLIHNFVFGWAIEWVFFVCEITALLIYHYKFSELTRKSRLQIAFFYFLFAWLSLAIIDGILSFMLTPGKWLQTQYFWHGFFNPTYFSSLFFRSFMCMMIAGLFGYITTVFLRESNFRHKMMRYNSKWLLYPVPGLIISGIWYYYSIPVNIRITTFSLNPQSDSFVFLFLAGTAVLFVLGIISILKTSLKVQRILTFLLVLIGFIWMSGFEYTREIARKPWMIDQYMYSTSILKENIPDINKSGLLQMAKWTTVKQLTTENKLQAGKELFNIQCLGCHTVNGFRNDIISKFESYTYMGILSHLTGQGKILDYMPPFAGTDTEREALAAYITIEIMQKEIITAPPGYTITPIAEQIPEYDGNKDDFLLLVWNDLGMHCISDSDPWFVILPPANTLEAQLIKRGETPELISENVTLTYEVEEGFEHPDKHLDFWKYAQSNFGAKLEKNIGLFGNGLKGKFEYDTERGSFIAKGIPVSPYKDDGNYNPYPIFTVKAINSVGNLLMETRAVTPVSTEMGCRNCHEGGWRVNNLSGIDDITAKNLLDVHDRLNNTDLMDKAENGKPQLCQSCHADPALATDGKEDLLNFSAAMHGWHANYMPYNDARACIKCHPASQTGNTRCNRGIHNTLGVTCTDCHGSMQEHALSLLRNEENKPAARRLMLNLKPTNVDAVSDVNPRMPWLIEPDCLTCHSDFEKPMDEYSGFNYWNNDFSELYRIRTDDAGIRCEACHGSTHALYPAKNAFSPNRDNIQPLQYIQMPYPIGSNFSCKACHREDMSDAVLHHSNIERMFRNVSVLQE